MTTQQHERATDDRTSDGLVALGLLVLWLAWVALPGWLVLQAAGELWSLFGESPSEAQELRAAAALDRAALLLVGVPVVGAVAAGVLRRQRSLGAFLVAALVGLLGAGVLHSWAQDLGPQPPAPGVEQTGPRPCQEPSGGETTCPGG